MESVNQKLSFKEKVGYSLGDSAANFIFQLMMVLTAFFYTDIFGIPLVVVSAINIVARIWDAVNDPMMGAIADRTKSRWGKFRPWILWTAVPLALVFVLTLTTPNFSMGNKIVWAYITFILLGMVYTMNNIPYSALTGVLTGDLKERTVLTSYRFVFAMLAAFVVQGLTVPMVNYFGRDNQSMVLAQIQGDTLTITENNPCSAKIIITAEDGQNHKIQKDFIVKVHKEIPETPVLITPPENITKEKGFVRDTVDIAGWFNAGLYGPLAYQVTNDNSAIVETELNSANQLIISEQDQGIGIAGISIEARDHYGSIERADFKVAVHAPENQSPAIRSSATISLEPKFKEYTLNLDSVFSDANGDILTYSVRNMDSKVVKDKIEKNRLVLKENASGLTTITVTAKDNKGGMTVLDIPVKVAKDENMPPSLVKPLRSLSFPSGFGTHTISLSKYFNDPDQNDQLRYSVAVVNQSKGYQYAAIVLGVLVAVFLVITFFTTKERVLPDPAQKTSVKQDLTDLTHNGPWIALFFLTVLIFVNLFLRGGTVMYYFRYYVGQEYLFSWFNVAGLAASIIGIFFSKPLAMRFGKRNTFRICLFFTALFTVLFIFLPPDAILEMFIIQIFIQLSYGPTIPMLWAMMADTADYSEWKTGRRATGIVFSAATFGLKLGWGIGVVALSVLLKHFKYVPNADQTETALNGLKLMMSVIPAVPFFLGVIMLFFYKIDKDMNAKMQSELTERRAKFRLES